MHAADFLKSPGKHAIGPLVVLYGSEWQLKQSATKAIIAAVLGGEAADELSVTRLAGRDSELRQVRDELLTVSMFGEGRVVIVEEADEFITKYRRGLEEYAERPARRSVLVLDCKSWRKNTRLAKKVAAEGLELECAELAGGRLIRWLVDQARDGHDKQLTRDAAGLLVELVGNSLGLLDQELSKVASYVGEGKSIGVEEVRGLVGGWKAETTWTMTGAVRDGQIALALKCLDQLLTAGEAPPKILGGINFVFRKFVQATELARQGATLQVALKQSGVFPGEIDAAVKYLRRIGRPRAERILSRLVQADADLKGGSRIPERLQMERLLVDLAGTR